MDRKDFTKAIKSALSEGTLMVGLRGAARLGKKGELDLIGWIQGAPKKEMLSKIAAERNIASFEFDGTNSELGELCKKPFRVSTVGIRKREAR